MRRVSVVWGRSLMRIADPFLCQAPSVFGMQYIGNFEDILGGLRLVGVACSAVHVPNLRIVASRWLHDASRVLSGIRTGATRKKVCVDAREFWTTAALSIRRQRPSMISHARRYSRTRFQHF